MRGRLLCLVLGKIGATRLSLTQLQLLFLLQQCVSKSISDPHICPVRSGVNPGVKRFMQTGRIDSVEFRMTNLDGPFINEGSSGDQLWFECELIPIGDTFEPLFCKWWNCLGNFWNF